MRKTDQMLAKTLARLDGALDALPSPKPGVYFDMLASPNGYTDAHPVDPSAFEGISPVEPDIVPAKPIRGLARVKRGVRFFESPLAIFEDWRARLVTDKGTYEFVGPKRISRDLNEEFGRIHLYFAKVTATKVVKVQQLTILDGCGEVVGLGGPFEPICTPGDDIVVTYTLNI